MHAVRLPEKSPYAARRVCPGVPHHAARAKRVVVLWQGGGPSHVDLFDPKPVMRAMAGQGHSR